MRWLAEYSEVLNGELCLYITMKYVSVRMWENKQMYKKLRKRHVKPKYCVSL